MGVVTTVSIAPRGTDTEYHVVGRTGEIHSITSLLSAAPISLLHFSFQAYFFAALEDGPGASAVSPLARGAQTSGYIAGSALGSLSITTIAVLTVIVVHT